MIRELKHLTKIDFLFFTIFYGFLFIVVFSGFPGWLCFILLISVFLTHIVYDKKKALLYPFAIFPFMFVIRAPDPEGVLLVILPDIIVLISMVIYIISTLFKKFTMSRKKLALSGLLFFHILLSSQILFFHIFDFRYIPIILRTFILPILFLFVMVRASLHDKNLPEHALRFFVISFTFIMCLALLQYFDIIKIPSDKGYLQPLLLAGGDNGAKTFNPSREILFLGQIFRINLLVGGAAGSAGAVSILISILCFTGLISGVKRIILYVMGFVCFFAGLLSVSTSFVIPIFVYVILAILPQIKKSLFKVCISVSSILILAHILYNFKIINDISAIDYFLNTYSNLKPEFYSNVNLKSILFGMGPAIFSKGYEMRPEGYLIDIGILRVMQDTGLFNFLIFFSFILGVIYVALKKIWQNSEKLEILYTLPFITLSLLIHGNFSMLPPFYVLFAGSAAGVLSFQTKTKRITGVPEFPK